MKQKIKQFSLKANVWLYAMPALILFALISFAFIPKLQALLSTMQLLDTSFGGYDPAYVSLLLAKLGSEGQHAYFSLELYADIPFIIFYTVTFTIILTRLLVKNGLWDSLLSYTFFLPLIAGTFDLLENIGILNILTSANIPSKLVSLTSLATVIKGTFLPLTLVSIVLQLGMMAIKRITGKK